MAAQFGLRLRKGAWTSALAAATVAALAASQAPGVVTDSAGRQTTGSPSPDVTSPAEDTASGNSRYYTDLPPLDSPTPTTGTDDDSSTIGGGERGIPATVLDAYKKAEASLRDSKPGCNLPWQLLAAIGKVESGQASGGRVDAEGTTYTKILGPVLNGGAFANISDTDNGAYDGDSTYDRAVGPMQFIPSTWEWAGRDGNGDGAKDPNNIYDAALAAGNYLCRFDWDLSDTGDLRRAILSYNNSTEYYNTVMSWLEYYRKGTHEIPDGTGSLPQTPSDNNDDNDSNSSSGNNSGGSNGNSDGNGSSDDPKTSPSPTPPKTEEPADDKPEGGTTTPAPPTTDPPSEPPADPTTPTDTVDHLENAGTATTLTAMAGDTFAEKITARSETKAGDAVAKVRLRFTIVGDTDTTFTGGESVATIVTNSAGQATAPALVAGEKTGAFTVRVTVVGRTVTALDYKATVIARQADALTRTTATELTCVPNGEFAEQVEVKATYQGGIADKVAVKATLIKSVLDITENDKGPYFKDADGNPVRTLSGLETDADGLLKLPKLYSDDAEGTFMLRLETEGGATLNVTLKVEAPAPTETTSESPSASAS
ncbi:lytic transglycosylase domain-containing protein [Streptomyces sp. NPDC002643]